MSALHLIQLVFKNDGNNNKKAGFGNRFGSGFASLRDRASELGKDVASSVNEMNNKVTEKAAANAAAAAAATPTSNTKAVAATPTSTGGGNSIATASKEELVEVLTKMNKKVKALSALRTQLQDKLQTTEQERDQLKSVVVNSSVMTKRPLPLPDNDENGDGSTNLATLSVQDLSKLWKEMESQDEQELLQLKRALSEQPQQQRVSDKDNNSDASAFSLREEQLKQEHNRAMAQKDDLIARLQKNQQQQQSSDDANNGATNDTTDASGSATNDTNSNSTTPSGEGSTSEREDDLKKRHAAEMDKLKRVAALQLGNFKKKVAAARSVELEKVKKATRAEVEKEFSQQQKQQPDEKSSGEENETTTTTANETVEVTERLNQQHAQEIQSMRLKLEEEYKQKLEIEQKEANKSFEEDRRGEVQQLNEQQAKAVQQAKKEGQEEANKAADAKIDKLLSTMKLQSSEHGNELQRVRKESTSKIEQTIKDFEGKAAQGSEESAAKSTLLHEQKLEARIQELQKQHNAQLQ